MTKITPVEYYLVEIMCKSDSFSVNLANLHTGLNEKMSSLPPLGEGWTRPTYSVETVKGYLDLMCNQYNWINEINPLYHVYILPDQKMPDIASL